jgi:hypothetical protein
MDHRDIAEKFRWYEQFDARRMVATCTIYIDREDGQDEDEVEVPCHYDVCPSCGGQGSYVNPSIDRHGISGEEWAEWGEEEREHYRRGVYDVACGECGGLRVVPVADDDVDEEIRNAIEEKIRSRLDCARVQEAEMRACYGRDW